jgi:hypothetical protein
MIKRILSLLLLFVSAVAGAQESNAPQMADTFRQEGKIYVVITVISIVFIALLLFLVFIERKLKRLEDKMNAK